MSEASSKGTRAGAIARARAYVESGAFEADLARRVAFKTESQLLPASLPELRRYLEEEMAPAFARLGFTTRIYDNPLPGQGPVLLATRIEDAKLPTVLGYGHGDVIRGLEDQWTKGKGPWVTARDGERLYGRGTADNKGQHTINMAALEAVREERGGRLGFNAKFIIEMGEEAGSKGLAELVAAHKADFAADVLVASDGPRVKPERPTMTLGCRGAINFDLVCDLREGGHHSGNWGGLIANPGIILAHALASIVGPKGELLVPALKAPAMSKAVKECAGRRRDRRRRGRAAGGRLVGRAGPDAGRARLRLQRVQRPGLHDRHARPAGERHPAQGRRQLPAALRRRHRRRRHHAGAAAHGNRIRPHRIRRRVGRAGAHSGDRGSHQRASRRRGRHGGGGHGDCAALCPRSSFGALAGYFRFALCSAPFLAVGALAAGRAFGNTRGACARRRLRDRPGAVGRVSGRTGRRTVKRLDLRRALRGASPLSNSIADF